MRKAPEMGAFRMPYSSRKEAADVAIYRCKEPFRTNVNGAKRVVPAGELVEDTDPVFKGREHLFEPVGDYVSRHGEARVERATAEPGEKRSVGRPAVKKTAAPAKKAAVKPESKQEPKAESKTSEGGAS